MKNPLARLPMLFRAPSAGPRAVPAEPARWKTRVRRRRRPAGRAGCPVPKPRCSGPRQRKLDRSYWAPVAGSGSGSRSVALPVDRAAADVSLRRRSPKDPVPTEVLGGRSRCGARAGAAAGAAGDRLIPFGLRHEAMRTIRHLALTIQEWPADRHPAGAVSQYPSPRRPRSPLPRPARPRGSPRRSPRSARHGPEC